MLVVFDIDGTLADLTHRRKYVKCRPKNWGAFYATMDRDEPIFPVISVLRAMRVTGHIIVIATGRGGTPANIDRTRRWLAEHVGITPFFPDHDQPDDEDADTVRVYIRAAEDYRRDDIIKEEILDRIIEDFGHLPDLVFDDRKRVVEMWRRRRVRVAQVDEGDF